jgi:hypothetical protein
MPNGIGELPAGGFGRQLGRPVWTPVGLLSCDHPRHDLTQGLAAFVAAPGRRFRRFETAGDLRRGMMGAMALTETGTIQAPSLRGVDAAAARAMWAPLHAGVRARGVETLLP